MTKNGILVAIDGSAESDAAVRWAAHEAAMRHAPITLIHVVVPVVTSWPVRSLQAEFNEWQEDNARQVIEDAEKTLRADVGAAAVSDLHSQIEHAHVVPALVSASKDAEMVVVGSRGLGAVGRAVLGSTSGGLLRHAHCPVAVIHADEAQAPDRTSPVLLGIDGTPASEAATALAFEEDRAGRSILWRCTRGAMSASSPLSV